ncbi:MAG: hypothetical protein D6797_02680 [Bdellovibrio sp.]|nr:MAG: hypothetical protein D6797_02680 [Bdellovibrio sp.]
MLKKVLSQFSHCPLCFQELKLEPSKIHCSNCDYESFYIQDIPWLFKHPQKELLYWKQKSQNLNQYFLNLENQTETERQNTQNLKTTNTRLEKLKEAYQQNRKTLQEILNPLWEKEQDSSSFPLLSETSLGQEVNAYYANIFRDWVWGEKEIQRQKELLHPYLSSQKGASLLFFGTGAGRLAWDLSQNHDFSSFISIDINPLLTLTFQKIIHNEKLKLYEFPLSPLSIEQTAILHSIEKKERKNSPSHFIYLFADGMNPPFRKQSFDTILTPWFIDIIPMPFKDFSQRVNTLLKPEGLWINFGPLGFEKKQVSQNFSPEEIEEALTASDFQLLHAENKKEPYLASPYSRFQREEVIYLFIAKKIKSSKTPKEFSPNPKWLSNFQAPIPIEPYLQEEAIKNKVQFEILAAIDGQRSINDICQLMVTHYKMTEEKAKEALLFFLSNLYKKYH